jgi:hypothetical protein
MIAEATGNPKHILRIPSTAARMHTLAAVPHSTGIRFGL